MTEEYYWEPSPVSAQTVIAQLTFLGSVPQAELLEIFERSAHLWTIPIRGQLFEQDTPVRWIYIIINGRFWQGRSESDGSSRTRRLEREVGAGAVLGIQDFLFADSYRTTARALETSTILAIDTTALNRLIYRHPEVRNDLVPLKIINRLRTMPLVGRLEEVALAFIAELVEPMEHERAVQIYDADTPHDKIYLIDQGQVRLEWTDGRDHWLGNGAAFGLSTDDGAIGARRLDHRATTTVSTQLFALPHADFVAIIGYIPDAEGVEQMKQREQVLEHLLVFSNFKQEYDHHMVGYVSHYYFPYSHVIVQQGEEADSLWVLMPDSRAAIHANDKRGAKLLTTVCEGPAYFAETALLGLMPQDSTIEATVGSEWLRLHWRDFERLSNFEDANLRAELVVDPQRQEHVVDRSQRKQYEWLQPGELIIVLSRRHWVAYLRKGLPAFIAFAILASFTMLAFYLPGLQWWLFVLLFFFSLIALALLIWGTIDYFNDWLVVTNRRVVHQEKVLFVNEWRKEAPLEQIQDVNFSTTFLGKWLNYGTMSIQTASTLGMISFDYTTHFEELDAAIKSQREQRRRHASAQNKLAIHRMLEARLGQTMDLPSQVLRGEQVASGSASWRERRSAELILPSEGGDRIVWRRHWMVLLPELIWPLLVLIFWTVVVIVPWFYNWQGLEGLRNGLEILGIVLTLAAFARVAWVVANWRNDTYEVTDSEIEHVEKLPFSLTEDRKRASLGRLQNVEMVIPSPWHWLLNYGNVRCQTAAEDGDFTFDSVSDPRAVAEEIQTRMERYRRREENEAAVKRAQELPDWFEVYRSLDQEPIHRHDL